MHVMQQRYLQIRAAINEVGSPGLEQLLLTPVESKQVENLSSLFKLLDSVTKVLQVESTSCADVRAVFDEVVRMRSSKP